MPSTAAAPAAPSGNVSPLIPKLAAQILDIVRREELPKGYRLTEQSLCDELGSRNIEVIEAIGEAIVVFAELDDEYEVDAAALDVIAELATENTKRKVRKRVCLARSLLLRCLDHLRLLASYCHSSLAGQRRPEGTACRVPRHCAEP